MKLLIRRCRQGLLLAVAFLPVAPVSAERLPVLRQIDVPHSYYYREMYLPQVASGPQNPSWSPAGDSLVYAMQGSLWQQDIGSGTAVQLTAGPGYDHQPDWSPDGRQIVFTRQHQNAMELHLLDLESGAVTQLTSGADVNLEPRWSPDGKRLAWVSTQASGRFHVLVGDLDQGGLTAKRLLAERKSNIERYYYSEYDHQISPEWSPDGKALYYVANPEIAYGSGSLWRHELQGDARAVLVRREETTWRAKPDIAPDGQRLVYASYLGRQWHQLWITRVGGKAEAFPLSYGEFDIAAPRWSPDGERIAFTSNEGGNTALRVLELPGGKISAMPIHEREYLGPVGTLKLSVTNAAGEPVSARVAILAADGRAYGPHDSWLHVDDHLDTARPAGETRYFHLHGEASITLPAGETRLTIWRGPEHRIERHRLALTKDASSELRVALQPLDLPPDWQDWHSADVHVHMNYGGIYRNTPANLLRQAEAEDLDAVFNLIVNKEQRVPDIKYFSGTADAASTAAVALQHSQEFHTGYWGHLGLLGLSENLLLPDYSAYPETAAASIFPDNVTVETLAQAQGAVAGYVHTFLPPLPDPANDASLSNALPVDAALGKVDYYEVVGFAEHHASAEIWYRLLNCGFKISAAGGTDAMANFASLRGPVGINRTYVQTGSWPDEPQERLQSWIKALAAGNSMATNGPLLGLSVNARGPGATLDFDRGQSVTYRGFMRSAVPLDRLELVANGKPVRQFPLEGDRMSADISGTVDVPESGWLLLRAYANDSHPDLLDMYAYATTSPIYVNVGGVGPRSREDAEYFLAWINRVRESAAAHAAYNSDRERASVLAHIDQARAVFEARR